MDVLNETSFLSGEGRPSSSNGLTFPKSLLSGTLPQRPKVPVRILSDSSIAIVFGVSSGLDRFRTRECRRQRVRGKN